MFKRSFLGIALAAVALPALANDPRVDAVFAKLNESPQPGCVAGVAQDGRIVHEGGYGLADVERHLPINGATVFNIASLSKQFTAFSLLLLEQRKAVNLDDPVVKYVPEVSGSARTVTLRQLLHHVAGLRDYQALLEAEGRQYHQGSTQYEAIQLLEAQRGVNSAPGDEYDYSNSGYVLLATVVERVSKQSLHDFQERNIFAPLGMKNSTVVEHYPAGIPTLARGYDRIKGNGYRIDEAGWEQVGDGQVHVTVGDLLRWADNFRTAKVGGRQLIDSTSKTGTLNSGEPLDYGAGIVMARFRGWPVAQHSGSWAGYRSHLLRIPGVNLAVAVMCNRNDIDPQEEARSIADIYLNGRKGPLETPEPKLDFLRAVHNKGTLEQMPEGWYREARKGTYIEIRAGQGGKQLVTFGYSDPLTARGDDLYSFANYVDAYFAFVRPAGAAPHIVVLDRATRSDLTLIDPWKPADLDSYAGTYQSDEADARCTIVRRESQLWLEGCADGEKLTAGAANEFYFDRGQQSVRFTPAQGRATEFLYFTHGLRGLRFARVR